MPHAFSTGGMKFPDDDPATHYPEPFPPHFFVNGENPQFRLYPELYRYCDRVV